MIEWQANRLWYQSDDYRCFGVNIGQRMMIVRLENGELLIHNPTTLTNDIRQHITKLGTVSVITTVNNHLHAALSDWWLAYPDAYFYSAPGLASVRTDIGFDGTLNSTTSPRWKGQLYQTILRGNDCSEDVVFCDPLSKTLLFGESILWLNEGSLGRQLVGKLLGCHNEAAIPFYHQMSVKERNLLRWSLQEILTWPFEHILPIHGDPIWFDGKKKLAHAYAWLLGQ